MRSAAGSISGWASIPDRALYSRLARAVASGDGALSASCSSAGWPCEGWPPVLVGPPDPEQALGELTRLGAVAATLRALASVYLLVIADIGFLLLEGAEAGAACRVHREALVTAQSCSFSARATSSSARGLHAARCAP